MNKTLYSVVGEILEARTGNPNFNMVAFVREKHPELAVKRVYVWIRALAESVGKDLGRSINEVYNKTGNAANELSLEQKRQVLEQVASIDDDKRGLYIREHGLFQSDLDTWKTEVCVAEQVQQVLKDAENRHQGELAVQKAFYKKKMQKILSAQNASAEANTLLQQELAQWKTALNKSEEKEKSTQARLNKSYQTISKLVAALQLSENF